MAVIPGLVNGHTHLFQTFPARRIGRLQLSDWLRQVIWPGSLAMETEDFHLAALIGLHRESEFRPATTIMDHHYVHTGRGEHGRRAAGDGGDGHAATWPEAGRS
ncbi:hypothetical protein ACFSKT_00020 [Paenibacillus xanthanilyticus]|uniref:amidohydrolase family protein n=1 Tax=Paenibacillus xanthanilyticus TaxID=1783531 RepID=UPI00362D20DE